MCFKEELREELSDFRYFCYKKYGHYCNKSRQMGETPVPYQKFKQIFITNSRATMKSIVEYFKDNNSR